MSDNVRQFLDTLNAVNLKHIKEMEKIIATCKNYEEIITHLNQQICKLQQENLSLIRIINKQK